MKSNEMLKWYFRTVFIKAGLEWTVQNDKEIDEIIGLIKEETRQYIETGYNKHY